MLVQTESKKAIVECDSFYELAKLIHANPNLVILAKNHIAIAIRNIIKKKNYEGQDEIEDELYFKNDYFGDEKLGIDYFDILQVYIKEAFMSGDFRLTPLLMFALPTENITVPINYSSDYISRFSLVYIELFRIMIHYSGISLTVDSSISIINTIHKLYAKYPNQFGITNFICRISPDRKKIAGDKDFMIHNEDNSLLGRSSIEEDIINSIHSDILSVFKSESTQYQFLKVYREIEIIPNMKKGKIREVSELYHNFFHSDKHIHQDSLITTIDLMLLFQSALDPTLSPKESKDIIKAKLYELLDENPSVKKQVLVSMVRSVLPFTDVDLHTNENEKIIENAIKEFLEDIPVVPIEISLDNTILYPDDIDIAMEANHTQLQKRSPSRGMKSSSAVNKGRNKVRKAFKSYQRNEEKIDSAIDKSIKELKEQVVGSRDEIIEGKKFSPVKTLRLILASVAVFSVSKVAAVLMLITRFALKKSTKKKERIKIVMELEEELEILNEKIKDADGDNNKKAKYTLMRQRSQIQNAINRIKYGIEADDKSVAVGREVLQNKS